MPLMHNRNLTIGARKGASLALTLGAAMLASACSSSSDTAFQALTFVQDRTVDTTGETVVVTFSKVAAYATANDDTNYTVSGGVNVSTAVLSTSGRYVTLTLDAPAVPGDNTISIATTVTDVDGTALPVVTTQALTSSDTSAPAASTIAGLTVSGVENDTIVVVFSDLMIESEVETLANWTIESPLGTAFDISGAAISYAAGTATITLDSGATDQNLHTYDAIYASFTTMRDLGGNTIGSTIAGSTAVTSMIDGDTTPPTLVASHISAGGDVVLTFSEPVAALETADLFDATTAPTATEITLTDTSGSTTVDPTTSTTVGTPMQATVAYSVTPTTADTLRIYGATDLAGNQMMPTLTEALVVADTDAPALDTGNSAAVAVSGEYNDTVLFKFNAPVHPYGAATAANYTVTGGSSTFVLSADEISFDQVDEVLISLSGIAENLDPGTTYTIVASNLLNAQGIPIATTTTDTAVATGDTTAPTISVGDATLDPVVASSVLIEFDEAVLGADLTAITNYSISGADATAVTAIGLRIVRVTFAAQPTISDSVVILAAALTDLSGNVAGGNATVAITAADAAAPTVSSVAGTTGLASGRDSISIVFAEIPEPIEAVDASNYAVTMGGVAVSLTGASVSLDSNSDTVTILLAEGVRLDTGETLSVTTTGIDDIAGNAIVSAAVTATIAGDSVAPASATAYVNWKEAATGTTVDVLFNESMDITATALIASWTGSGSQTATTVTRLEKDLYRVVFSAAIGASDTISVATPTDLAGNVGSTMTVTPVE